MPLASLLSGIQLIFPIVWNPTNPLFKPISPLLIALFHPIYNFLFLASFAKTGIIGTSPIFTNFQLPVLSNTQVNFTGTQIIGTSRTNSSRRDSLTKKDVLCVMNDSFPLELVMNPVLSLRCLSSGLYPEQISMWHVLCSMSWTNTYVCSILLQTRQATLHWGVSGQGRAIPNLHATHPGKPYTKSSCSDPNNNMWQMIKS